MEKFAKPTGIVGGVRVFTEKRYSVRFALMCRSLLADALAGYSTGEGMAQLGTDVLVSFGSASVEALPPV